MADWHAISQKILLGLNLKPDDPDAKRKVFDAYPFGKRAMYPYKAWNLEVHRAYPWLRPKKQKAPPPLPDWLKPKESKNDG